MSSTVKDKRRRARNTVNEQYNIYLLYLENDSVFCKGLIDNWSGDKYIEKKWAELTTQLNSVKNGPVLTAEEWKKRFNDWKYATRWKLRKLTKLRETDQPIEVKISDLEERAIAVWGITLENLDNNYEVTTKVVHRFPPLTLAPTFQPDEYQNDACAENVTIKSEYDSESQSYGDYSEPVLPLGETEQCQPEENEIKDIETQTDFVDRKRKRMNSGFLTALTKNLISCSTANIKTVQALNKTLKNITENYISIQEKCLKLERDKLMFEIAKFKYQNKDFKLDL